MFSTIGHYTDPHPATTDCQPIVSQVLIRRSPSDADAMRQLFENTAAFCATNGQRSLRLATVSGAARVRRQQLGQGSRADVRTALLLNTAIQLSCSSLSAITRS